MPQIFDVHAHLWCNEHWGGPAAYRDHEAIPPALFKTCPFDGGRAGWTAFSETIAGRRGQFGLHAGRPTSAVFIPIPDAGMNVEAANAWVLEQVGQDPSGRSRALMLVTPRTTAEEIAQSVSMGVIGLKCYHCFAEPEVHHKSTFDAPIAAYVHATLTMFSSMHALGFPCAAPRSIARIQRTQCC
jgi:hypothetical protein